MRSVILIGTYSYLVFLHINLEKKLQSYNVDLQANRIRLIRNITGDKNR